MNVNLKEIDPEKIKQLIADLEAESNEDKLASYKPYPKQAEFHEAGAKHRERLLMAGNQLGKTLAGAFETAMHLTGRYPEWWKGKRFDCSIMAWAGGDRGTTVRDTVQAKLVGPADAIGTGTIPKDALLELVPAHGVPGLFDTIRVRHVSGGGSLPLASRPTNPAARNGRAQRCSSFGSTKSRRSKFTARH